MKFITMKERNAINHLINIIEKLQNVSLNKETLKFYERFFILKV